MPLVQVVRGSVVTLFAHHGEQAARRQTGSIVTKPNPAAGLTCIC